MGCIEHGHVLHVLVHVPWVRFDEVKAVVDDDPTDPVILCLDAVVLVSLPPVVVQVSSACLTKKEVNWFYSFIAVASSCLNRLKLFNLKISVSPNGLKTFSLFVLVVQTVVVQMSL